jgi:uncharacterized protein YdhG (YjbR/CyaY superfamily)
MGKPTTVAEYFDALPSQRKAAMEQLRDTIRATLPSGYEECLQYGMPGWVVPHALYPPGYHADPKLALPFLGIASQKNHVAVYHMGIYASATLMDWFVGEYPTHCKTKLNMGKSCIRFKNVTQIPFELLGELCSKMSPEQWIEIYEEQVKKT